MSPLAFLLSVRAAAMVGNGTLHRSWVWALVLTACNAGEHEPPILKPSWVAPAPSTSAPRPATSSAGKTLAPSSAAPATSFPPVSRDPLASQPLAEPQPRSGADAVHAEDDPAACPPEMVLIHGDYCTDVRQDCTKWIDPDTPPFPRKRCGQFAPSVCIGQHKHLRFCIDKYEYAKTPEDLPVSDVSWTMTRTACESMGKHICQEAEWVFACEGEEMRPYPTGFVRDATLCNYDRDDLVDEKGKMRDLRKVGSSLLGCASPFGVMNMVGNVDEWTWREGASWHPWRAAMKGGWWLAGRNRCRPATTGHDEYYHDLQAGFRCCKDVAKKP